MEFQGIQHAAAKRDFILWLKKRHPRLYADAMRNSGINLGDFASSISSIFGSISSAVQNLAPAYLQTQQQIELLRLNIKRAQQGLTPYATYAEATGAGAASTPAAPPPAAAPASSGVPGWLILAGLGLLAFKLIR